MEYIRNRKTVQKRERNTSETPTDTETEKPKVFGGGRNRGVNLPSPCFLSQFLPPPSFWANFSLLPKRLPHIFSLLPTFSPYFSLLPTFFGAISPSSLLFPPFIKHSPWSLPDFLLQIWGAAVLKTATNIKYSCIQLTCPVVHKEQWRPVCIYQSLCIILKKKTAWCVWDHRPGLVDSQN